MFARAEWDLDSRENVVDDPYTVTEQSAVSEANGWRKAFRAGAIVCAVLIVIPFLVPPPADPVLVFLAVVAILAFMINLPYIIFPLAIIPTRTLWLDGNELVVQTLFGSRHVDLTKVERIWARTVGGGPDTVVVGMSGADVPRAWVSWQNMYLVTDPNRLSEPVRAAAARPDVHVTPRARRALGLPGAPTGLAAVILWLRGAVLLLSYMGVIAALAIGYGTLLWGPPWG
jgi:hypothetical protein